MSCFHQIAKLLVCARDYRIELGVLLPLSVHRLVYRPICLHARVVVVDEGGKKGCINGRTEAFFPIWGESE